MPAPSFTDTSGRTWRLVMNYGLAEAIEQTLGVDFANAHNGQAWEQLARSDKLFVQTLAMICEEQLTAAGVTPGAFARSLAGEQFEAATEALGEMVVLFTRPAMRPVIEQALAKGKEQQAAAIELAVSKLNGPAAAQALQQQLHTLSQQMDQRLQTLAPSTPTSSPGSGPESSG